MLYNKKSYRNEKHTHPIEKQPLLAAPKVLKQQGRPSAAMYK